jgi:hypothetical protein
MAIKRVKLSDASKKKGITRDSVKDMPADEIRKRANTDPDNPLLTDEQTNDFELAKTRKESNDKKD